MARKTINAGVDEEYIRSLGVTPFDERKRPSQPLYVRGEYANDPLGTLLWADLRQAYRRHRIDAQSATMFELVLAGQSYRQVAKLFHLDSHSSVQYRVENVQQTLIGDDRLGIMTVIYEECGGWEAVHEYLFG